MKRLAVLLVGCMLVNLGCASYFKRKECEKTNWYQHGFEVAMKGQRLDTDNYTRECRKVEAEVRDTELDTGFKAGMSKYCTADNVFAVGKAGHPFSYEMCDGESLRKMRVQYENGLKEFCTPANAYRFGSGGGVYENVCHRDTEESFQAEYRKGRKVYLNAVITQKEGEVMRLNGEISQLEGQRQLMSLRQMSLNRTTSVQRTRVFDPTTGTYRESLTKVEDPRAKIEADQINSQIYNINYEIERHRREQRNLSDEIGRLRTEMIAL